MKTREEIARFVENQFDYKYECPYEKGQQFHYGKQEVRHLLDFIFDGPPTKPEEFVRSLPLRNR